MKKNKDLRRCRLNAKFNSKNRGKRATIWIHLFRIRMGNYFFITNSSKYHLKIERELLMLELNNAEVYGLQASLTLLRSDELS